MALNVFIPRLGRLQSQETKHKFRSAILDLFCDSHQATFHSLPVCFHLQLGKHWLCSATSRHTYLHHASSSGLSADCSTPTQPTPLC